MKSDELVAMWTEDSRIDYDYEKGIRDIPKLHAKYINIYLEERKKQIWFLRWFYVQGCKPSFHE